MPNHGKFEQDYGVMSDQQYPSSDEDGENDDYQYVYSTSPTEDRQDFKKTRVYDKIKVANLLHIEQNNKASVNKFMNSTLTTRKHWNFNKMRGTGPSDFTPNKVQSTNETSRVMSPITLENRTFTVDAENPQGQFEKLSYMIDDGNEQYYKGPITQPLQMNDTDLKEYMSRRNSRRETRRIMKSKNKFGKDQEASNGLSRQATEKMLMDNLVSGSSQFSTAQFWTVERTKNPGFREPFEKKAELDERFFKKLLLLKQTPEYKNRPDDFFKHEFSDKLIMIDKIDKHMCKPFSLNNFKSNSNKSQ